ncbi:NAD(P)H-dependent oxidoreductase [Salinicola salarius]
MPAMLKGWFDRVFVYGGIYNGERRFDRGMLQGKRALYSFTTGGPAETFSPLGRSGDIAKLIWPLHCSLYYVGFDVLPPHPIYGVQGGGLQYQAADAFRKRLEEEKHRWKDRLTGLFEEMPIPFTGWSDWNEAGILLDSHPLRWRG